MSTRTARRESPAVNAGSMADIAFLLLIFFLVTTTISEDRGILVQLPKYTEEEIIVQTPHVLKIYLNAQDELLVEDRPARPYELPGLVADYVRSPLRTPKQAVVSLIHDRSTTYTRYLEVYDALRTGYRTLWEEEANRRYGTGYSELTITQKQVVRGAYPLTLSEAEPYNSLGI